MGIVQLPTPLAAQSGLLPSSRKMVTTDNISTVTTAGYLNAVSLEGYALGNGAIVEMLYGYNQQNGVGTYGIFTVSVASATGKITLSTWISPGSVTLPVVSGDVAIFDGTTGKIKDSGLAPSSTSSQLFVATTPGTLTSGNFPRLNDVNGTLNAGKAPTDATKTFVVMSPGSLTSGNVVITSDANGSIATSSIAPTNIMLLSATNTLSGSGRIIAVKANGTESSNAVTASGMAGAITTSALTTDGGTSYAITWTNTFITATSSVLLTLAGGTNTVANISLKCVPGSGTATLTIYNNSNGGIMLDGTIIINYLVI